MARVPWSISLGSDSAFVELGGFRVPLGASGLEREPLAVFLPPSAPSPRIKKHSTAAAVPNPEESAKPLLVPCASCRSHPLSLAEQANPRGTS
jgi:hypothetical protein